MSFSNKILLDSIYLLPIVGVDVEGIGEIMSILKMLRERRGIEYYYTSFNILEIIGKLGKTRYDEERIYIGLSSIKEEFNLIHPTIKSYIKALKLKATGFKDLIDLLLYTTSLTNNIPLLTRDIHLIEFLKEHGETIDNIIYEKELVKKYLK